MWTFPIIEKLGGLDRAFELLTARGFPMKTRDAIRMWRSPNRGVIPGDAAVELMRICDEAGIAYDAEDFKLVERERSEPSEAAD